MLVMRLMSKCNLVFSKDPIKLKTSRENANTKLGMCQEFRNWKSEVHNTVAQTPNQQDLKITIGEQMMPLTLNYFSC